MYFVRMKGFFLFCLQMAKLCILLGTLDVSFSLIISSNLALNKPKNFYFENLKHSFTGKTIDINSVNLQLFVSLRVWAWLEICLVLEKCSCHRYVKQDC